MKSHDGWLRVTVIVALVVGIGGFVAGQYIVSPREVSARTEPPPPTLITEKVLNQKLSSTVLTRGIVTAVSEVGIGYGVLMRAGSLEDPGGDAVLTALSVEVGDTVRTGDVLAEVSGRPMIVLPGQRPMYRDMVPGIAGADVRQLNEALQKLGYYRGIARDVFSSETERALAYLYRAAGYSPSMEASVSSTGPGKAADDNHTNDDSQSSQLPNPVSTLDLPRTEIVFVPDLPARVSAVSSAVGFAVPQVVARLTASKLVVVGSVPVNQGGLLAKGDPAEIELADGSSVSGRVRSIGAPVDGQQSVAVAVRKGLDFALTGQSVKLTFTAAESSGEVLAVPPGAVTSDSAGRLWVVRVGPKEKLRRIAVTTGVSGDGLIEITPAGAELGAGDRVLIGR